MRKLKDFTLIEDPKFPGIWIRKESCDVDTLRYIKADYSCLDYEDKVVMDIGACFGGFSKMAIGKGARQVIAYEPDPVNWELINKNVSDELDIELINAAVVGSQDETVTFYQSSTKSFGIGTLNETRGRNELVVDAVNFHEELHKYKPSVLKIDCEGGEYGFLDHYELPDFVEQVVMELHLTKRNWRRIEAPSLIAQFDFWECIKEPNITGKNWATIGAWKR